MKKVRKSPDYFDKLLKKKKEQVTERADVAEKIVELGDKFGVISSIP